MAEYMLSINVPDDAPPGLYVGSVTISAGGEVIAEPQLVLEVLPADVPTMDGYWIGGIYNMGYAVARNDEFYVEYGKSRFNYLMLFDYFSTQIGTPPRRRPTQKRQAGTDRRHRAQLDGRDRRLVSVLRWGGGVRPRERRGVGSGSAGRLAATAVRRPRPDGRHRPDRNGRAGRWPLGDPERPQH